MKMEHADELKSQLADIEKWENEQKDIFFWEKLGRLPFVMLDKLTPKIVRDKLGDVLNEMGAFIQNGGKFLVNPKTVLRRINNILQGEAQEGSTKEGSTKEEDKKGSMKTLFKQLSTAASSVTASVTGKGQKQKDADHEEASAISLEQVSHLPVLVMDQVADDIISERVKFAAASGAATGVGGFITMAADMTLVLGNSLKTLQEIAICYGYDPNDPMERVFVLKCLQFSSADIVGKKAILTELATFDEEHTNAEVISQIQGWREVVNTYRDSLGWKQLFQMIPIAGIIFGSISNKGTLSDVSEAGKMLYKKRRLLKRLAELA
ncbi:MULTISPECIES: EcsC family protein [unclassified Paenibacillus]|uniref:EcsC family protein n=2 Tax=Paenibacillus TaxID=44249 RepID=UPI00089898AC|nr:MULTISPECIES: EcsC family protein [unclassified Paenibacillus]SDX32441.1 EcsC protein family protein [Paenibacillus sp. PDC88]